MRKLLSISLLVFVMALLVVSCSPESKTLDEGLALISFSTDGGETRSLTKTDPVLNPDDFYWYYEATKTDGTGLVTGVTDGPTPVDTTDKGLNETVGPFSYGEWSFTLYAYAGENRPKISDKTAPKTNLAYTGSASKIISKTSDTLEVVVASKQTKGETVKGTLLFPVKTAMIEQTLNDAKTTTSIDYSKLIEKITVTCVDGSDSFHVNITSKNTTTSTEIKEVNNNCPTKDFYEYSISKNVTKNDETVAKRYFELEPGSYSVKFSYYQNAKVKSAGDGIEVAEGKSEYILVAEETIYVAVADYLTTEIGGTIASNTGRVKITVKNGITAVTISQTIKNNSDTVFDSADSADDTARSSGYKVSIPAGGLKGTSAVLDSEIYSPEVASEKNADYLFESGGAVIGGESSTLYEDNSSEETKTFGFADDTKAGSSTNKAKRVTKTITLAKNLNGGKYYVNTSVYPSNNDSYENLPETLPKDAEVVTGTDSVPDCDIVPKYQGDKTDYTSEKGYDIPNGVICYYNPASGLTVYQVEHFSTYFFKSKTAVYYDVENRKAYATLKEAIEDTDTKKSGTLILLADTTETVTGEKGLEIKKALTLNLNGHTLTLSDTAKDGETAAGRIFTITAPFTVKNGTIKGSVKCSVFRAETNGNLTLDGIIANVDSSGAVVTSGGTTYKGAAAGKTLVFLYQGSNPVYATIRNSNLEFIGTYCIGSNANTTNGVSYINLTIENSTITAKNDSLDDNKDEDHTTGLLANVPGTVIIKNSVISGSRQGAILRGGTYTINGSTFKSTGSTTITTYDERDWSTGNGVPAAALVVGNRSKSYAYPTEVTFEGTNTLVNTDATRKQIYIYKADEVEGDADVDRSVTVEGFNEDWSVNNNFNGAVVKSETTLLVNDGETLKSAISCVAKGETIKFTNDITCTLSDTNSSDGCDTSLWFESENVTMDFNSKKLVVRSNYGGSLNIINAFGAGCTFKNGEIFVYRKTNGGTVSNGSYGYDATYPCWDSYALGVEFEERGDCIIESMKLHGGIAIYGNVDATIKRGTYADATNYYALHAEENCTATVEECTFNGAEGSGIIFEMLHSGCSVTVKSGTYTGKDLLGGKGSLSITGGTFSSDPTSFVDTNTYTVTPDSTESPTSWTVSEKANGK